ncbi:unnamed protein product [Ceutorhynchus assimilis]|uniref:G patch domain-containing protein n=1 Tax=Ceutorhynchus assimilis TaxID=467358 RepID=A0A9N9QJW3_9CUCU|nr:unnamed protein product [Ceutorhynchus assimilis]
MSDSEDDNDNFCFYGQALDPYDEDSIPKRRPISVEEQIATDAQGRRRFHGAFTGGFSAGFFNTVGSLEGWTPSEFKSSRSEKSKGFTQKPLDFMDDEDVGEDGIAPQVVKATSDYNTSKKRKKQMFSEGPIPGEPVLHNILTSGNETVGYMLLKNLRLQDKTKKKQDSFDEPEEKTYGCQMPKIENSIGKEEIQYEIPQMYKDFLATPKTNTFGLGYSGLEKSHFSLFPVKNAAKLVTTDKNKKVSITGQAFGVGAFEEEDDDIYMKDDMTKYDFELTAENKKAKAKQDSNKLILGMFEKSKKSPVLKSDLLFPPPTIPHSFTGKHKIKKSRFEPVVEEEPKATTSKINPMTRAKYLGEDVQEEQTLSEPIIQKAPTPKQEKNEAIINSYLNDKFVSSTKDENVANILETVEKMETIHGTEQMREAARMKMFGGLTRITTDWQPCALLCKRFNVPEPFADRPEKSRTKTKNIIFEYQKHKEEEANLQPGLKKEAIIEEPEAKQEEPSLVTEEIKPEPEPEVFKPIDITERIHLEEKQDLFKAVFLSSDSESEEEAPKEEDKSKSEEIRKEELKSVVLSEQLLLPKIKPLKEGVLSGIHKFVKPARKLQQEVVEKVKIDSYGPKIPENPIKIEEIVQVISTESEDEWIEKDSDEKKKKKKHKKEKKQKKDKHKKNKQEKKKKY